MLFFLFKGCLTKIQTTGGNVPGITERTGFTLLETTFLVVSYKTHILKLSTPQRLSKQIACTQTTSLRIPYSTYTLKQTTSLGKNAAWLIN